MVTFVCAINFRYLSRIAKLNAREFLVQMPTETGN